MAGQEDWVDVGSAEAPIAFRREGKDQPTSWWKIHCLGFAPFGYQSGPKVPRRLSRNVSAAAETTRCAARVLRGRHRSDRRPHRTGISAAAGRGSVARSVGRASARPERNTTRSSRPFIMWECLLGLDTATQERWPERMRSPAVLPTYVSRRLLAVRRRARISATRARGAMIDVFPGSDFLARADQSSLPSV